MSVGGKPARLQAAAARLRAQRRRAAERLRQQRKREFPFVRSTASRVAPDSITLVPMRSMKTGTAARRLGWFVQCEGQRAGRVTVVRQEHPTRLQGKIDVQLNQHSRGRGIGTVAFRRASELSGCDEVFAIIAKSNTASWLAATRAGFVRIADDSSGELCLVWTKNQP